MLEAAARCTDPVRRERIRKAAHAVEAQTATLQDWEEQVAAERAAGKRSGLPPLPELGLRDMFPGLTVRIPKTGEVLHFQEVVDTTEQGGFMSCTARLTSSGSESSRVGPARFLA